MNRRTKAMAIPPKVKKAVYERDWGRCIFCGSLGLPEAHYISRAHGGLGVEPNIVTSCRRCHDRLDNSPDRPYMLEEAKEYLKAQYPEWDETKLIYRKGET